MENGRVITVSIIGEEIAAFGKRYEIVVNASQTHSVLQQERLTDMMHRLGFGWNSELAFREDIPRLLVI